MITGRPKALRYIGYLDNDLAKLDEAIATFEKIGSLAELSHSLALKGMLLINAGEIQTAIKTLETSAKHYLDTEAPLTLPENPFLGLTIAHQIAGSKEDTAHFKERAGQVLADFLGASYQRWLVEAKIWVSFGKPELGDYIIDNCVEVMEPSRSFGEALANDMHYYRFRHDYARADKVARIAHQMLGNASRHHEAAWALIFPARFRWLAGNHAEAAKLYVETLKYLERSPFDEPWTEWFVQQEYARLLWHLDEKEEALKLFADTAKKVEASLRAGQQVWGEGTVLNYYVCARRVLGDDVPADLRAMLDQYLNSDDISMAEKSHYRYFEHRMAGEADMALNVLTNRPETNGFLHFMDAFIEEEVSQLLIESQLDLAVTELGTELERRDEALDELHPSRAMIRLLLARVLVENKTDLARAAEVAPGSQTDPCGQSSRQPGNTK